MSTSNKEFWIVTFPETIRRLPLEGGYVFLHPTQEMVEAMLERAIQEHPTESGKIRIHKVVVWWNS
jgi:hypothetical protein